MSTPMFAPDVLHTAVEGDAFWEQYLQHISRSDANSVALHLAILVNPYLRLLLEGQKTIESRFSKQRRAPYNQVQEGDIVLFKRSGGPILGIGVVAETMFYELTSTSFQSIQAEFAEELCIHDPAFWAARSSAAFATLLRLAHVRPLPPLSFSKRDQRAWVVLQRRVIQPLLWSEEELAIPTS